MWRATLWQSHSQPALGGLMDKRNMCFQLVHDLNKRVRIGMAETHHRRLTTRSVPISLVSSLNASSVMMSEPPVHNRSEIRAEISAGYSIRSRASAALE